MANDSAAHFAMNAPGAALTSPLLRIAGAGAVVIGGSFLLPPAPFIIDGAIYYDMARAMADRGALHIGDNGGVEGAPELIKYLTQPRDGLVYPQYPSGYAFLAAPFYLVFGIRGLMLMNALAAAMSIWLTFDIGKRLFNDRIAAWGAGFLTLATFTPTYMFAVWPHMITLALWLGAIRIAVAGHETDAGPRRMALFLTAGLVIGAGINIRYDMILAATALFFWFRFFARPDDRIGPLLLLAGMAPGLLFSAYVNQLKFGVFTPMTYGPKDGVDSLERYLGLMAAGSAALAASLAVNLPKALAWTKRIIEEKAPGKAGRFFFILATIAGLLSLNLQPVRDYLYGLYVLIINLQAHNAYHQVGVGPNEYGQILFWGYPKKAFVQSLPYLPLLLTPAVFFLRGKQTSQFALCFLAIGAPVSFYALNQWHGGAGYSLRYFLPALPFITILSAWTFTRLMDAAGGDKNRLALITMTAAGAVYLLAQEAGRMAPGLFVPAALYPQWAIAAALTAGIAALLLRPGDRRTARAGFSLAVFALAYAAVITVTEAVTHENARAEKRTLAEDIARAIPEGALVVTPSPNLLMLAEYKGVSATIISLHDLTVPAESAKAFAAAGRCVYFHGRPTRNHIARRIPLTIDETPLRAPSRRLSGNPRLEFFPLASQRDFCAFREQTGA